MNATTGSWFASLRHGLLATTGIPLILSLEPSLNLSAVEGRSASSSDVVGTLDGSVDVAVDVGVSPTTPNVSNESPSEADVKLAPPRTDYWEMIKEGVPLVDKSLLARDIWEAGESRVLRPRRSGKTLNLQMVRCFYEVDFFSESRETKEQVQVSVEDRETHFLMQKIGKSDPEFVKNHCGKFPVLYVSLQVSLRLRFSFHLFIFPLDLDWRGSQ